MKLSDYVQIFTSRSAAKKYLIDYSSTPGENCRPRGKKMKTYRNFTYITALLATLLTTGACGASSTSVAKDALTQKTHQPLAAASPNPSPDAASSSPSAAQLLEGQFSDGQKNGANILTSVALAGALAIAPPTAGQNATVSISTALSTAEKIMPGIENASGQAIRLGLYSQAAPGTTTATGQSTTQTLCWLIFSPGLPFARHGGPDDPGRVASAAPASGQGDYISIVNAATGQSFGTYAFSA